MTRSFDGRAVDEALLDELCAQALWAPTAGNSAGVRLYTLGAEHVAPYFEVATDASWRERSRRVAGLTRAGGLVLVTARPQDYLARYAEDDKATSGLDERDAWPLPYWHTDAAMATMALLLLLEEQGVDAVLWGSFRHDLAVMKWARVKEEELFATVLVGYGDGRDEKSSSLRRSTPTRSARVTRLRP